MQQQIQAMHQHHNPFMFLDHGWDFYFAFCQVNLVNMLPRVDWGGGVSDLPLILRGQGQCFWEKLAPFFEKMGNRWGEGYIIFSKTTVDLAGGGGGVVNGPRSDKLVTYGGERVPDRRPHHRLM